MDWKSVEKYGLPETDDNKTYLVRLLDNYGYGSYVEEVEFSHYEEMTLSDGRKITIPRHKLTGEKKWYLDFDNTGLGDQVTHYVEIIDPV